MVRKYFSICLLLFCVCLAATPSRAQLPSVADRSQVSATEFDVNGLKVIVKQRPKARTVAVGLFFRGGSANLSASNAGIESLLLNVATDASLRFPRLQLRAELARMATSISSGANLDYSALSLACLRENFDRSWEIFGDVALHPALTPDDVGLEKSHMIANLKGSEDDPDSFLQTLQAQADYIGHPYENPPDGTVASLQELTVADLRAYHQRIMQTSRLLLVLVGDLDLADLRAKVTKTFGQLPRGTFVSTPARPFTFAAPTIMVTQRALPTNYIQGIFAAPPFTSIDTDALLVATTILQDRLFEEIRVKRQLSYAPSAFFWTRGAPAGGVYATAVDVNQTVGIMRDEIARLQRESVTSEDISSVAAQYLTRYYLSEETSAAQAGELAQYELIGGGWRRAETMVERIRSVTPGDVQRVAQQYMKNLQFVVLGNDSLVNRQVFLAPAQR
jgi:predicted Zn-dependent peptidase